MKLMMDGVVPNEPVIGSKTVTAADCLRDNNMTPPGIESV
jgi:hypothetical protein